LKKGDGLQDYMGKTELAANLFRVTQTEERLKAGDIQGQMRAEQAHENVAKQVRAIVRSNTGITPDALPVEEPIKDMKGALKEAKKKLNALESGKK